MTTVEAQNRFLPVAEPVLSGNERAYVLDCLDTNWISSNGSYIDRFETSFARFCGVREAISICNGTAALHVALLALGVGPGDEVIVPTLTYVATANAVTYCGAKPVFVDVDPDTWNIDAGQIEGRITPCTRGMIVVHLFGHPADMDPILELAARHGLFVLEDAAEAHGAEYKGRRVGSLGHAATFSFYGNKIITTGEGGMITTDDEALARRMRQIKGQGQDPDRRYWFPIVGYNYRMTNIEAAIGLAQLEDIAWHIERRRENAHWYAQHLRDFPRLRMQPELPWAKNVYWMNSVVLDDDFPVSRDEAMAILACHGIETRPFFYPMHVLPMYSGLASDQTFPVADSIAARGMNLPSAATLTPEDIVRVAEALRVICAGEIA